MGGLTDVSISITSAIIYIIFGGIFFILIFLLVMVGVTDCNWDCNRYNKQHFRRVGRDETGKKGVRVMDTLVNNQYMGRFMRTNIAFGPSLKHF